ncbi:CoA transferase [Chelativorans sp. YIM 93263]|uniref:CoA transferase n=1 Tax=Chelativorans sp. YIM 93263 TaxID=2906648 RepID=UPI002379B2FD|nr:CoA transferase [Chelativorans sp. YIM 93263]
MSSPFSSLHVVDLSGSIAGNYCSRLFLDFGAQVTLAEPENGASVRHVPPFDKDRRSLAFHHLNTGKRVVDLPKSKAELADLVAGADVAIVPQGFKDEIAKLAGDRCVCVEVSAFGADGPYAGWQANEMVHQALSGMMSNNGEPGREPLYGVGNRASYAGGVAAYITAMVGLFTREDDGQGQKASVDVAETAAAMCFPYVLQYFYNGTNRRRGDQDIPAGQVLCEGTWVCIWIYPHRFAAMCKALGLSQLIDDPRFAQVADRVKNWAEMFDIIQDHVRDEDAEDVVSRLQEAQVISACAYRPSELLENPHLAARQYWDGPDAQGLPRLGAPFRLSRMPRSRVNEVTE